MAGPIAIGAPVDVPAGVYEDRLAAHVQAAEHTCVERAAGALRGPDHDALEVRDRLKRIISHVLAAVVSMERRIDIGAGVGEQLDLPDLEGRAGSVTGLRCVARQPVADRWHREARVGDHPVLDRMAHIDEPTPRRAHEGGARRAGSCW